MKPLISIITVTYNAANVIEPTMKSVAEQTFRDFEHIIVDGNSSDSTLSIAGRFAGNNMKIFSRPDTGIYHGMNRGLKYAEGEYIIFLNAGDRFASPSTLARYAEASKGGAEIIYGDTNIVTLDGKIIGPRHLSAPNILTARSYLKGMLICHQAFMVRRSIAPAFSREFKLSADYEWCLQCIQNSKITRRHNLHCVTIHYLEGGMSQKKKIASLKERFIIMKRHFGVTAAVKAHLSFIPRMLRRRFGSRKAEG